MELVAGVSGAVRRPGRGARTLKTLECRKEIRTSISMGEVSPALENERACRRNAAEEAAARRQAAGPAATEAAAERAISVRTVCGRRGRRTEQQATPRY